MSQFTRRKFVTTAAVAAAAAITAKSSPSPVSTPRKRPNFLFFISDQMRADALAVSGNKFTETPNLDRLAKRGVRFSNAYCAQALCTPSRGAMLSGVYPHTSGLDGNVYKTDNVIASPEFKLQPIWPQLLRQSGYYTSYIGKWHLGDADPKIFDEWAGYNSLRPHWTGKRDESQYQSDIETQQAIQFLEKDHTQPFLLMVSYYPPHKPYDPPMRDEKIYVDKGVSHPDYWGGVTAIDREAGRVLDKLKELGLSDNTFVIFMADHGDTFGERMGSNDKTVSYDDSAKIPLLFSWPNGLPSGVTYTGGVITLDLMPSILEAAGIPIPARLQGKSRLNEIRAGKLGWKEPVFLENITQLKIDGEFAVERAVRVEGWKLILRDHPRDELYCLTEDPEETKNLLSDPSQISRVKEMSQLLHNWGKRMGDPVAVKLSGRYVGT